MAVQLHAEPFDPWAVIRERERGLPLHRLGAAAVFVGRMRDFNDGREVRGMFLEHYPGMTERELERIVAEAEAKWPLEACEVAHRVGAIEPSDTLVLVAVWSAHRVAARDACSEILERLKHEAPFWKRERLPDGSERWVEQNTPGR
ncbi:molybdenum cofactor biosynthesis protein MoaE [Thioalkalivibrio paradoxus]|uniref:Molybdopterin synthase catalytic subunit n=1 Tax=Thioalkalivibrio paradoxus ARh 1 TaxID=713585 RepID=W0DFQ7_9GAMM|nr:molybdenum cofactor biosynthesis protein MoaE [Thioalkalivibrio paradoxus]AHE97171.1 molybdopterin converting factor [Thioalkalivibrio paradoxus ARh 1]